MTGSKARFGAGRVWWLPGRVCFRGHSRKVVEDLTGQVAPVAVHGHPRSEIPIRELAPAQQYPRRGFERQVARKYAKTARTRRWISVAGSSPNFMKIRLTWVSIVFEPRKSLAAIA